MTNSLSHVGILGMHWGKRKSSGASTSTSHPDHTTAMTLKGMKLHQLSNDQLTTLTKRLQLEKQFKDLSKTEISAGQKLLVDMLVGVGKQTVSSYTSKGLSAGIEAIIKKHSGG